MSITIEEKNNIDLMSRMIPTLQEDFIKGIRKSIFPSLKNRISKGEITDETVLPFVEQLKIDIEAFKNDQQISECAFFAPRRGSKNKVGLQPYIILMFPHEDKVKSLIRYQQNISLLTRKFKEQEFIKFKKNFGYKPDYWTNHDESSIKEMVIRPFAPEITDPTAMPIEHTPNEELNPIIDYLKANKKPSFGKDQLNWCTIYADGRFDSCKQGTGKCIKAITEALVENDKIKHFLYGNNIMGIEGCDAIRDLLINDKSISKINTWYLAGNNIDSEGILRLENAIKYDNDIKELWLKRNPLKSEGAKSIGRILSLNTSIETLDLDNTGLMDEGLEWTMKGLQFNRTLKTLYMDANGFTSAIPIIKYFSTLIEENSSGIDSLWLGINRLTDDEIIPLVYVLGKYKYLKRLCIGSNMLTSESARAIYHAFKNHSNIEVLDLGKYKSTIDMGEIPNILRDEGAFWIAKLIRENQSLKYVNMSYNGLTSVGVKYLIDALDINTKEWVEFNFRKYFPSESYDMYINDKVYSTFCTDKGLIDTSGKYDITFYELHPKFGYEGIAVLGYNSKFDMMIVSDHITDNFNDVKHVKIDNKPAPKLMFLQIDERIPVDGAKLETIMKKRREVAGVSSDESRFIKHGPTIENIDSIYRNNSK